MPNLSTFWMIAVFRAVVTSSTQSK